MPLIVGPLPTVISPKPREEQPTPQPQPSAEQQDSQRFWTSHGYPQYGGRYAPVNIPVGTRIKSVSETSEGLTIIFTSKRGPQVPREERKELQAEVYLQQQYVQPQTRRIKESVSFYQSIGYPEFGGRYAPFDIPEGATVQSVREVRSSNIAGAVGTPSGLEITFTNGKVQARKLSARQLREERQEFAAETRMQEMSAGIKASQRPEYLASIKFWQAMGYPLYGGLYAPFDVPAGVGFESITETPEGLQINLKMPFTESTSITKDVFVPSGFGMGSAVWVSETTGEPFMRVGDEWVKMEQGLTPSPQEQAAMLKLSAISAIALPVNIPKLAVFATAGIGIGEAYKFGTTGKHLTIEEIIGAASVGELVGLTAMSVYATPKVHEYIQPKVSKWLTEQYREGFSGSFAKEDFAAQNEFGFQKGSPAIDVPVKSWAGWPERIVMKVTGARPYIAGGEVHIPTVETVNAGVISRVPSGEAFTDFGFELTVSPRMSGLMVTKWPTVTTPKAMELFLGIGEELIPFGLVKGEGESLGFTKATVKAEPTEKGLPSSMLDESYAPKLGSFDTSVKDVNVRGLTSWSKWPTIRSLMEEQKLLPFTTQTQVTRLGITPFIPDLNLGMETTRFLGSGFMLGLGAALVPKTSQQPKTTEFLGASFMLGTALLSKTTQQPKESVRLKAFQESFQLPSLKSLSVLDTSLIEKQEQVPAFAFALAFIQETKQVPSLMQIQIPSLVQIQTPTFKTPTLKTPTSPPTIKFPSDFTMPKIGTPKLRRKGKRGQGLYLWEFEILEPGKAMKKLMGKRK